jgi:hypothetical protein
MRRAGPEQGQMGSTIFGGGVPAQRDVPAPQHQQTERGAVVREGRSRRL